MGDLSFGIEKKACSQIAHAIQEVHALGVEIGLVVGGGNIFRGNQAESFGFARTPADHIGMMATAINGIILQQSLHLLGVKSVVLSALQYDSIIENYTYTRALEVLAEKKIAIFVAGTGNPYFTTDTAAALRASEMEAEILLKATKVDGIYSDDPKKNPKAVRYDRLTYADVLTKQLGVMDSTAVALCRENRIPIMVFNLFEKGALMKAVCHKQGGTLVQEGA